MCYGHTLGDGNGFSFLRCSAIQLPSSSPDIEKVKASIVALDEKRKTLTAKLRELEKELETYQKDEIVELIQNSGMQLSEIKELFSGKAEEK